MEFAVIRLDKLKLREDADKGSRSAKILLSFLKDTSGFLSCISIGNTLANLLLSSFVAVTFSEPLSRWLAGHLPQSVSYTTVETATTVLVTVLLTYVVLVCGETSPKQFAIARGDGYARRMAAPLKGWACVIRPVVSLVNFSVRSILFLFGIKPGDASSVEVDEEQIMRQVEYGEQQGSIEPDEKKMIENVFELNDRTAFDVMVHRKDVVAIEVGTDPDEIRNMIREVGYSRYPVYTDSIDNVIGVLNARDFLLASFDGKKFDYRTLLRKPLFVPETVRADVLLATMQKRKQALAVVVDEFGGTSGIVTVEDLVEEVVGEIYDEYDNSAEMLRIVKLPDGTFRIPGEMPISDVNAELKLELPEGEFSTIGGYVIEHLGSLPTEGTVVENDENGVSLTVERMDGTRVESIVAALRQKAES